VFTFRVGPFPVTIEPSFLIVAVLLGPLNGPIVGIVSWALVVFASVLVHELGHAVVGRSLGAAPQIYLRGLGGVTLTPLARRLTPGESIKLSLAGPLAGLLPAVLSLALLVATNPSAQAYASDSRLWGRLLMGALEGRTPFENLLFMFVTTGFFWTILNLLPVLPLDGGQVLAALLAWVRKKPSLALSGWISAGVAALLSLLLFLRVLPGGFFLAILFAGFALQSAALGRAASGPAPVRPVPIDPSARAEAAAALDEARAKLASGDAAGAEAVSARLEQSGDPLRGSVAARIRAGVLLSRGEHGRAGVEAGRAFALVQEPDSAVVAARAALRAGEREVALTWLRRAVEAGARPEAIAQDAELSAVVQAAPAPAHS
jgi:Zn-dependent protease